MRSEIPLEGRVTDNTCHRVRWHLYQWNWAGEILQRNAAPTGCCCRLGTHGSPPCQNFPRSIELSVEPHAFLQNEYDSGNPLYLDSVKSCNSEDVRADVPLNLCTNSLKARNDLGGSPPRTLMTWRQPTAHYHEKKKQQNFTRTHGLIQTSCFGSNLHTPPCDAESQL